MLLFFNGYLFGKHILVVIIMMPPRRCPPSRVWGRWRRLRSPCAARRTKKLHLYLRSSTASSEETPPSIPLFIQGVSVENTHSYFLKHTIFEKDSAPVFEGPPPAPTEQDAAAALAAACGALRIERPIHISLCFFLSLSIYIYIYIYLSMYN